MRALLASLAAVAALLPIPAAAVDSDHMAFVGDVGVNIHKGNFGGRHGDGRRHNRNDGAFFYEYDRDYQGDTVWRSDSFNDWWHDNPQRAYPRWMLSNQNCDRMWWGGGAWRC